MTATTEMRRGGVGTTAVVRGAKEGGRRVRGSVLVDRFDRERVQTTADRGREGLVAAIQPAPINPRYTANPIAWQVGV